MFLLYKEIAKIHVYSHFTRDNEKQWSRSHSVCTREARVQFRGRNELNISLGDDEPSVIHFLFR